MNKIPLLWNSPHGFLHREALEREAAALAAGHQPAIAPDELSAQLENLRGALRRRLRLEQETAPLDFEVHGEIALEGYVVRRVSFASAPGVRVTGTLYVPEGPGPFPAMLNMHGHWAQGKLAAHVQARCHVMALTGFVVLAVDAAGSGERADDERVWSYHGAMRAAELLLTGDTLLGFQVRDNRRALDLLQSLPFVDPERIGATGASGGGNQTMWLAACDERVKAAVPVVSVGSFQAYVCARNCMCETLPGGLHLAEEWMVLGLVAPRALLVINALDDQPAFSYRPMSATCRLAQEVYVMKNARDRLDYRALDMTHGYHRPVIHLLRNWMLRWVAGRPEAPDELPDWAALPEEELFCYAPGARPKECSFRENRAAAGQRVRPEGGATREGLARLVGWREPKPPGVWVERRSLSDGTRIGAVESPRGLTLPVAAGARRFQRTRILFSPEGKHSVFVARETKKAAAEGWDVVAADLPGVGELAWEPVPYPAGARLHDTARACLWLGRTLAAEWAEAMAAICLALPGKLEVVTDREAGLAALLCRALAPEISFDLVLREFPESLADPTLDSLAWCLPGFLEWGDLETLRALARA